MSTKGSCKSSEFEAAAGVVLQHARDGFLLSLQNFDDVFKNVEDAYCSGHPVDGQEFSACISPLIGVSSDLILRAGIYKKALSLFHSMGVIVPSPDTYPLLYAFTDCLKHCANSEDWKRFNELQRRIGNFQTFMEKDHAHPMDDDAFDLKLDDHITGMTTYVTVDLCTAVIGRENDIKDGCAVQHPDYIGRTAPRFSRPRPRSDGEKLDYILNKVDNIDANTQPANVNREFIYRLIDRMKVDPRIVAPSKSSIEKAVEFIRKGDVNDPVYGHSIALAIAFAQRDAKPQADGIEKFWNSILSQAKPCNRVQKPDADALTFEVATPNGW